MTSLKQIEEIISKIPDPEIPVISIKELGVLRKIEKIDEKIIVTITPTYSGCPAMDRFQKDIKEQLEELEVSSFEIQLQYDPAWTTDWITEDAKKKLKKYGIAPSTFANAFVNDRPFVTSNIIGATSMTQLKENIDSVNISLSKEILEEIDDIHLSDPNPCV